MVGQNIKVNVNLIIGGLTSCSRTIFSTILTFHNLTGIKYHDHIQGIDIKDLAPKRWGGI